MSEDKVPHGWIFENPLVQLGFHEYKYEPSSEAGKQVDSYIDDWYRYCLIQPFLDKRQEGP